MRLALCLAATTLYSPPDHAYGDWRNAIEYTERLVDAGADEILCLSQMGTVSHEVGMETIRQWGEHVIPYFRAKGL